MTDTIAHTIVPGGPNADQIKYWNAEAGAKWSDFNPQLDRMLAPLSAVVIDRAAPAAGDQVLDIGCGCGDTTMALAQRVAPDGAVTGVDISTPMLDVARRRVADLPVTLFNADAETNDLGAARFDLAFSRFGVMFFQNPSAAFANLRRALRPDGRLSFICWQAMERNPWMLLPVRAASAHIELPAPPEPGTPESFNVLVKELQSLCLDVTLEEPDAPDGEEPYYAPPPGPESDQSRIFSD